MPRIPTGSYLLHIGSRNIFPTRGKRPICSINIIWRPWVSPRCGLVIEPEPDSISRLLNVAPTCRSLSASLWSSAGVLAGCRAGGSPAYRRLRKEKLYGLFDNCPGGFGALLASCVELFASVWGTAVRRGAIEQKRINLVPSTASGDQ